MENRRASRKESNLSVEVYTRTEVIPAGAENVSDDGVCLLLETELTEDELVGVSMFPVYDGIEDPDAEPMNLPARVVWCNTKYRPLILAGVRFVDPHSL